MTSLSVKGIHIGEGRPKTIVSLMSADANELVKEALRAVDAGADCLEWRADYARDVHDPHAMARTAQRLMAELPHTPVVFTFRSAGQGGELNIPTSEYVELNRAILQTRGTNLIDVELDKGDDVVRALVNEAHAQGAYAIVSHHDFVATPDVSTIKELFARMASLGADLPKLAVMARSTSDCLRAMDAAAQAHDELGMPLVSMAMGEHGKLSRLAGEAFGCALTFCALEKPSAPGQVDLRQATELLNQLHNTL